LYSLTRRLLQRQPNPPLDIAQKRHIIQATPDSADLGLHSCCQREVIDIDKNTAFLIVAIVTAAIAFATLVLKIVEVARKK
jgi:hypothetical protein